MNLIPTRCSAALGAALTAAFLGGCAASAPDEAYDAFERGVRDAAALAEAHVKYRTDEAWQQADGGLHSAGASIDVAPDCFTPLRALQRAAACAAGWLAHDQQGAAAPACERPVGVLNLPALPEGDGVESKSDRKSEAKIDATSACALEVQRGSAIAPLRAPEVPLGVATNITSALAAYADAMVELAESRDVAGINAATTRIERTLGGLSQEIANSSGSDSSRRAGPASGLVLNVGSLLIDARRRNTLRATVTAADPLVRDAAATLSYLLVPAYLDRLGELAEKLDAALDAVRLAGDDAAKFHRAMKQARRARERYVALGAEPPGAVMQALAEAHAALVTERADRVTRLEDAVDSARTLARRARRAREAFVRE